MPPSSGLRGAGRVGGAFPIPSSFSWNGASSNVWRGRQPKVRGGGQGAGQTAKGQGRKLATTLSAEKGEAVVGKPGTNIPHHACGSMETGIVVPQLPESEARRAPEDDGGNKSVDGDDTR